MSLYMCKLVLLKFLPAEDDLGIVFEAIFSLAGHWNPLCLILGVPKLKLDAIKRSHPACVEEWLSEGLSEWLRRNYDTHKYGLPSWRTLIKRVDSINCDLAMSLAKKHGGKYL